MPSLPTISECRDINTHHEECAHSNGKPDVSLSTINMDIRFAPILTLEIQIKHLMKPVWKPNRPVGLRGSQRVPPLKKITMPSMLETAPGLSGKPLADLMLHPEKVEAVLKATRNHDAGASPMSQAEHSVKPVAVSKAPDQNA